MILSLLQGHGRTAGQEIGQIDKSMVIVADRRDEAEDPESRTAMKGEGTQAPQSTCTCVKRTEISTSALLVSPSWTTPSRLIRKPIGMHEHDCLVTCKQNARAPCLI